MSYRKFFRYMGAYLLWILILFVALVFAIISQSTLRAFAAIYYVNDEYMREMLVRFLDKSYILLMGLIWLVLMVVGE